VLAVCAMVVASSALATTANAAKKPDLVIAGHALHGLRYAFEGERGRIIPHDITRNVGTARAGPSVTRAYLGHGADGDISEIELGKRSVPGLAPKTQSAGDIWNPTHIYNYPIGAYLVEVCADNNNHVAESNESNNCVLVRNSVLETIKVFIVRRIWDGRVGGTTLFGATERYNSTNAKLTFDKPIRVEDGVFAYNFAGRVNYTATGVIPGCTYSGHGSRAFSPGGTTAVENITFDYLRRRYTGSASVDAGFSYAITQTCGSSVFTFDGPLAPQFFVPGEKSFPFGATHIGGNNASAAQNWNWDFD